MCLCLHVGAQATGGSECTFTEGVSNYCVLLDIDTSLILVRADGRGTGQG